MMQQVQKELMIIKGKRTKRRVRPHSPLGLVTNNMPSPISSSTSNSGGAIIDVATSSTTTSIELRDRTTTELEEGDDDEDMAYCLILLAQGHNDHDHNKHKASQSLQHDKRLSLYQCKTCDRRFPSFQALGGHRASHKKANGTTTHSKEEKQQGVTSFVNELHGDHYCDDPTTTTSTILSLQLSSASTTTTKPCPTMWSQLHRSDADATVSCRESDRAEFYGSNTTSDNSAINARSKVHECSICGAEFSSGQALGGHMRRHRNFMNHESQEAKKPRNDLSLDLNLPAAPEDEDEDDHHHQREPKFKFGTREKVVVFSASSLVDCHY